jgi:hypothetical protein
VNASRTTLCAVVLAAVVGALASPALADHVTLGVADAKTTADTVICGSPGCTVAQSSSSEGSFTVPADGRIVSWWAALGGGVGSGGALRVLRRVIPLTLVRYQAVGTSSFTGIDHQNPTTHHDTDLPVQANDLIGLTFRGVLSHASDTGALDEHFADAFADGTVETPASQGMGVTEEYGAELVFRPVVTGLDTSSGPMTGGGTLTIAGAHLTESTAVLFGSTAGTGMTVVSNTRITVQIPAGTGTVDVTVVGPGGTSLTTTADQYTYLARSATVSPSVLDFGHTLVGHPTGVQSVTLTNNGKVPVSVGTVTLGGADPGDFATLSDGCGGHDIPAGSSCAVKLVFTPAAAGAGSATLRLADNSSDGPHTVVLTGTGDSPAPPGTTTITTTTTVAAPTTTTTPKAPRAPSSAFTVGGLNGTKLRITVHSRGTVRVAGRLLRASRASGGPGVVVVKLRLTAPARTSLARRHRLALRVRITFTPHGGKPATKTRSLLLRAN